MEKLVILFHGTKYKSVADKIMVKGFKKRTYFAKHLEDAVEFGGKYVFEVVFRESELPDNWQVICLNPVPVNRIVELTYHKREKLFENKKLSRRIFRTALELEPDEIQPQGYAFTENNYNFL